MIKLNYSLTSILSDHLSGMVDEVEFETYWWNRWVQDKKAALYCIRSQPWNITVPLSKTS